MSLLDRLKKRRAIWRKRLDTALFNISYTDQKIESTMGVQVGDKLIPIKKIKSLLKKLDNDISRLERKSGVHVISKEAKDDKFKVKFGKMMFSPEKAAVTLMPERQTSGLYKVGILVEGKRLDKAEYSLSESKNFIQLGPSPLKRVEFSLMSFFSKSDMRLGDLTGSEIKKSKFVPNPEKVRLGFKSDKEALQFFRDYEMDKASSAFKFFDPLISHYRGIPGNYTIEMEFKNNSWYYTISDFEHVIKYGQRQDFKQMHNEQVDLIKELSLAKPKSEFYLIFHPNKESTYMLIHTLREYLSQGGILFSKVFRQIVVDKRIDVGRVASGDGKMVETIGLGKRENFVFERLTSRKDSEKEDAIDEVTSTVLLQEKVNAMRGQISDIKTTTLNLPSPKQAVSKLLDLPKQEVISLPDRSKSPTIAISDKKDKKKMIQ